MASKYAGLRGKIPQQEPTERDERLRGALAERRSKYEKLSDLATFGELTKEFNAATVETARLAVLVKNQKLILDATEILIKKILEGDDAEAIKANDYTWTPTFEPYPVAENPVAIIEYFKKNGMEDQLQLTTTELAGRLKNFVKAEALANELVIVNREETDPNTGETRQVQDVRSNIPGVKVFLKAGLSRVKSSNKGVQ